MFRILIVDDNLAMGQLLQELMKNSPHRHEFFFAQDGLEALELLHRRGAYADVPRPHLILLDMNMPRLSGLDTLSRIKADPDLRVIPVIMLSTAGSPEDVRKSYRAGANAYLRKPATLQGALKLVQAVENFWMDLALLSGTGQASSEGGVRVDAEVIIPAGTRPGPPIATTTGQAAWRRWEASQKKIAALPDRLADCEEHDRLLREFGDAVLDILKLHEQQYLAIIEGDSDSQRFDLLIHMASEKKQTAKYDYIQHVGIHGCKDKNAFE
jgi:chemotaxis family two-component system response regulator Rcp1